VTTYKLAASGVPGLSCLGSALSIFPSLKQPRFCERSRGVGKGDVQESGTTGVAIGARRVAQLEFQSNRSTRNSNED
jgi:hypothetical protein